MYPGDWTRIHADHYDDAYIFLKIPADLFTFDLVFVLHMKMTGKIWIGILICLIGVLVSGCVQPSTVQSSAITVKNVVITYNATEGKTYEIGSESFFDSTEVWNAEQGNKFVIFNFSFSQPESVENFSNDILYTTGGVKYKPSVSKDISGGQMKNNEFVKTYLSGGTRLYVMKDNETPSKVTGLVTFKGKSDTEEVILPLHIPSNQ